MKSCIYNTTFSGTFQNPIDIIDNTTSPQSFWKKIDFWKSQKKYIIGYFGYDFFKNQDACLYVYDDFTSIKISTPPPINPIELTPSISQELYIQNIKTIREKIRNGDVYQINYTFPMTGHWSGNPDHLFQKIIHTHENLFATSTELPDRNILSFSPELFFQKQGDTIICQPMKGTAAPHLHDDVLQKDEKNTSENLMITDLIRNDLAKICTIGSVQVSELFKVIEYPSLKQMVSTIKGALKPDISLQSIMESLHPCGSITGAPKIKSMEVIKEIEGYERGIYTGALGIIFPNGDMQFSIGIRTLEMLKKDNSYDLRYCVGSGIVYDSDPAKEYEECLLKSKFLQSID